jgi:hypothetical protein
VCRRVCRGDLKMFVQVFVCSKDVYICSKGVLWGCKGVLWGCKGVCVEGCAGCVF